MTHVVVVGAGVVGLTTAVLIQQRMPGMPVTLIADQLSPHTTGDGSAGLWEPYLLQDTPSQDIMRWAGRTYQLFRHLWCGPDGASAGISLVPLIWLTQDANQGVPAWSHLVLGFTQLCAKELDQLSREHSKKYCFGFIFSTFICEPSRFLPYLLQHFQNAGGVLELRTVTSIAEEAAHDPCRIVINCTGLQAGRLASDATMVPIRGQVMRVRAPWINHAILDDSDMGNYIIPNQDSVVLGGTHQMHDWNTAVNPTDRNFILRGCCQMIPSLHEAEVREEWVGLRPSRPQVRVEREVIHELGRRSFEVIHNYGHGGSGITLCWGCAHDVLLLVQQRLQEMSALHKL